MYFTPSVRHPIQLMCSGRMGALFASAHFFAVSALSSSSSFMVALRASQFPQSNPQHAIKSLVFISDYFLFPRIYALRSEQQCGTRRQSRNSTAELSSIYIIGIWTNNHFGQSLRQAQRPNSVVTEPVEVTADRDFFWCKSGAAIFAILPQLLDLQELAANS